MRYKNLLALYSRVCGALLLAGCVGDDYNSKQSSTPDKFPSYAGAPATTAMTPAMFGAEPALSTSSADAPPNPNLKPPGLGWFCFQNKAAPEGLKDSYCEREETDCEVNKETYRITYAKYRADFAASTCTRIDQAACITYYRLSDKKWLYFCYASGEECLHEQSYKQKKLTRDYSHVSACGAWD
jgi:hypothetical protein